MFLLWSRFSHSEPNNDQGFLFSYELYREGSKHFDGTKYLSMIFEIESQLSQGEQLYIARLKKGIVSETYKNGLSNSFFYFATGEPINEKELFYSKLALSFIKDHPIYFSLKDGKVQIENSDTLKSGLASEIESLPHDRILKKKVNFFSIPTLANMFQYLFVELPDNLRESGDVVLEKGVVYNYLENYDKCKNVEISDIKKHEKLNVFLHPDSDLVRYAQISRFPDQQIVRVLPLKSEANSRISGEFPLDRNSTIQSSIRANASLVPRVKYFAKTDSSGKFSLALNLSEPVTIYTNNGFTFYAEPGDDFSFKANATQDSLFFSGIGADNNRYLEVESRLDKLSDPKRIGGVRDRQPGLRKQIE